jgi:cellulose synthase/poly-beta-1,6-N-acetylglucosamine synthase-like glycosyltransferase
VSALVIVFWVSVGLLLYAHVGYPVLLTAIVRLRPRRAVAGQAPDEPVTVSVIVPAYAEQEVIGARIANLRSLDYPTSRLEVIVACDGSPDATAERARDAGADIVLELPRGGKIRAQDVAVASASGRLLAFSDANVVWEPDALKRLIAPFSDQHVGYVCGQVRLVDPRGDNQEGLYWRYEMALRELESRARSVTGGNGAIYATRPESYLEFDGIMGHDLSFPFNMVKRGWLALYVPEARASEPMVPTITGEFARKRRMSSQAWRTMVRGGMLSPRGYDPLYAGMIASHRLLRYATPFLHLIALGTSIALIGHGWVYIVAVAVQLAVLAAAVLARVVPVRLFLIARYYVLTTAALAAGLWDWLRRGAPAMWEPAEGTR